MSPKKTKALADTDRVDLRVSSADLKRWRLTAALADVSLAEWIRSACEAHAVGQESVDLVRAAAARKKAAARKSP